MKCQKETLLKVTQNQELLQKNESPSSQSDLCSCPSTAGGIQEPDFVSNMAVLDKAKSVQEVLDNDLIKHHFQLIERDFEPKEFPEFWQYPDGVENFA